MSWCRLFNRHVAPPLPFSECTAPTVPAATFGLAVYRCTLSTRPECLSSGGEEGMGGGSYSMCTFTPGAVRQRRHAKLIKAAGQQLDAAAPPGFRELWANWVTMPRRSTAPRPQCLMGARGKRLPLTRGDDSLLVDGFRCLQNFSSILFW